VWEKLRELERKVMGHSGSSPPERGMNVASIAQSVRKIERYLTYRDSAPFYGPVDTFFDSEHEPWYQFIKDENLRTQLELDHVLMLNARARDDMLDYCLRAHMQIEAVVQSTALVAQKTNKQVFNNIWKRNFEGYTSEAKYKPSSKPPTLEDIKKGKPPSSHLTDAVFLLLYNARPQGEYWRDPYNQDINQGERFIYYTLQNVRKIRNEAVHRTGRGINFEKLTQHNYLSDYFGNERMYKFGEIINHLDDFVSAIRDYGRSL
jgi:hypothetical protein